MMSRWMYCSDNWRFIVLTVTAASQRRSSMAVAASSIRVTERLVDQIDFSPSH
jgi:hypothetical protein